MMYVLTAIGVMIPATLLVILFVKNNKIKVWQMIPVYAVTLMLLWVVSRYLTNYFSSSVVHTVYLNFLDIAVAIGISALMAFCIDHKRKKSNMV